MAYQRAITRWVCAWLSLTCMGVWAQTTVPRIVTLTPHASEMVHAAGGSPWIVATVSASDYPPSIRPVPKIGSGLGHEIEPIVAQHPTLVVGWPSPVMSRLKALGYPTFETNPQTLDDIPDEIDALGLALHTEQAAHASSQALRVRIASLSASDLATVSASPKRVAILVDADAGFAIGGQHILNDVLKRCGGVNVLSQQRAAAPLVSAESLWATQPDVIILGGDPPSSGQIPFMIKGSNAQILTIDADLLFRPGPRLIQAAQIICAQLSKPKS